MKNPLLSTVSTKYFQFTLRRETNTFTIVWEEGEMKIPYLKDVSRLQNEEKVLLVRVTSSTNVFSSNVIKVNKPETFWVTETRFKFRIYWLNINEVSGFPTFHP